MANIRIEYVGAPTPDAAALIAELDEVLGAVYEPEQRHGLSVEQVFGPNVRFFIARIDGSAVGCGAVALFDGYAEVKRMYTREAARGQGVGKAILARLEAEARAAGKPVLHLETGIHQAPAIGLYEGCGFRGCAAFGHYAALQPHRIAASIFYEKLLPQSRRNERMIRILTGFPDNVLAAACEGQVTRQDYDDVLVPAVNAALERHEKLRLYYEVTPQFAGITAGAVWEDFVVGMEHLSRWERMAVVTDVEWMRFAMNAFRFLLPGRLRVFAVGEAADARRWIAADVV